MLCGDLNGKESKEEGTDIHTCSWFALLYSRNEHNIVKELYYNLKKKKPHLLSWGVFIAELGFLAAVSALSKAISFIACSPASLKQDSPQVNLSSRGHSPLFHQECSSPPFRRSGSEALTQMREDDSRDGKQKIKACLPRDTSVSTPLSRIFLFVFLKLGFTSTTNNNSSNGFHLQCWLKKINAQPKS